MTSYTVSANGTTFGTYEGATEQEARDLCAQDAGYQSEADMAARLEQPSELIAVEAFKTIEAAITKAQEVL